MKFEIDSVIERVCAGDEAAFADLCKKYEPLIRSMSANYAYMVHDADNDQTVEDFFQEANLALFRAARSYNSKKGNGKVSFGLYAKVCIRNALVSELRKLNRKKKADRVQEKDMESKMGMHSQSVRGGAVDISAIVKSDLLSPFEEEVFAMYAGGVKVRDIAKILGRSSKSVSNAVYRIKTKVRLSITEDSE